MLYLFGKTAPAHPAVRFQRARNRHCVGVCRRLDGPLTPKCNRTELCKGLPVETIDLAASFLFTHDPIIARNGF